LSIPKFKGSVGSEEKVEWLLDELKIDYALNYKTEGERKISSEQERAVLKALIYILIMWVACYRLSQRYV
jgi:NADPH-dependent curcumin reductase CurA